MRVKSLLAVAALAATVAQASAFEWTPVSLSPNPSVDITTTYFMANVNFNCQVDGVQITDVMPVWVDENGNEIKAITGEQNPWGFDPTAFIYTFDESAFKANGEYTLLFPEGMLLNADGEKSDKVETYYSVDVPELAPGMFDDFEVLTITPDLSQPQAIWTDQVVTLNTNHNDAIGLTMLRITDTYTGEIIVSSSSFTTGRVLGDKSPISWEVAGSYKFFEEHVYVAEFIFYNGKDDVTDDGLPTKIAGRASFEFTGRVEGYKYSSLELLSVDPDPMSEIISQPSQAVFTYTFSGPVTVYQAETPLGQNGKVVYPPSCLSSNEDKTVWTLDLSDNEYVQTVDALLTIYVYAKDMDGYQLHGNWGIEGESCFQDEWPCDLGAFPIEAVTPTLGESIDCLSEVVVKAVNGDAMSWSWMGVATVKNQLGEILGTLVYDEGDGSEDSARKEIRFTKWMDESRNVTEINLVAEGRYFIDISSGCFLQGDQFESKQSKGLNSAFSVTGELDEPGPGVDPAEQEVFNFDRVEPAAGSTVTSLLKIQLWYPDVVACEEFFPEVYNKADNSIVATGFGLFSWDDWNLVDIDFSEPVTEAGEYEVVIPARVIYTENFVDGSEGICNPEIRLTYTVAPEGDAVESVESVDSDAVYYDLTGRRVLNPSKGIYISGGKKVIK